MELDSFSVRICNIARLNRKLWPQPRIRLMEEAGVFESSKKLNPAYIRAVIEQDPSLIEDWLAWSEDKRYNGAWLNRSAPDMISACAEFIMAELWAFKEIRERKNAR